MPENNSNLENQSSSNEPPQIDWYAQSVDKVIERLNTNPEKGLSTQTVQERLEKYGGNRLREEKRKPLIKKFLEEMTEPLLLMLIGAAILYIILGEVGEGITVFVIVLILTSIEVFNEQRAKKAISSLKKLAEPTALVIRNGKPQEIAHDEVVPGDVVLLMAGRDIPADARLIESSGLAVDESSLTGESLPVDKDADQTVSVNTALADRSDMVYAGTVVTRGRGKAVVVTTGVDTQLGQIAKLAKEERPPRTPLQKAINKVSKSLIWVALAFSVLIPLLGVLITKQPLQTMFLTGLSLAFVTIPEELPIIITMVLAIGGYRLSKQNAIVKNLKAVETLGAVTIIAADKTGTLTENQMAVSEVFPQENRKSILETGYLCNDAIIQDKEIIGDPLEVALINAVMKSDVLNPASLDKEYKRINEFTFDNDLKRMSVVTEHDGGVQVWVKGAPESLLSICTRIQSGNGSESISEKTSKEVLDKADAMAKNGLRVLAFAQKEVSVAPGDRKEAESGLTFLGIIGLLDPPRPQVKEAIQTMRKAGIRTMMITGDHPLTALAIAKKIDLGGSEKVLTGPEIDALSDEALGQAVKDVSIFARITPENKLRIVSALEAQGERVAVTGDGVNDAPALVKADIGVAMGETGSDVAREAGDIILADDNYATIASAVREGRHLFANLKKGIRYYLSIKLALILVMLLPALLKINLPFQPVQIIMLELFVDLAAAASFTAEPAESGLMKRPPRNIEKSLLDSAMIGSIMVSALGLFAAVEGTYLLALNTGASQTVAQTMAYTAWLLGHILLAFNMRSDREPVFKLGFFTNRVMDLWGVGTLLFVIVITMIPFLENRLHTTGLNLNQWLIVIGFAIAGTFWHEVWKWITYRKAEG